MNSKKFLALLLAVAMMFICTSCATITVNVPASLLGIDASGNNQSPQGGSVTPDPVNTDTNPGSSTPAPAPDNSSDTTPADTTPAAPDSNASQPGTGAPSGKSEIVKLYCDAYNKIGTDSKSCTRIYDYTSNYNNILNINGNSTLEGIANTLMTKFMVENTDAMVGTVSDLPPVGLSTLNITDDKVSDAVCNDTGAAYEVTIKSTGSDDNYEMDCNPGDGSVGLFGPLLKTEDVANAAGSMIAFEGLHAKYATASVKATIDKASGHITKMEYLTPCILHFDQVTAAKIIKVKNCDIGLLFQQTWTIEY